MCVYVCVCVCVRVSVCVCAGVCLFVNCACVGLQVNERASKMKERNCNLFDCLSSQFSAVNNALLHR